MSFDFNKWLSVMVYNDTNKYNQELLRKRSLKYINNLDSWKQFILHQYTLKSSQINKMLTMGIKKDNTRAKIWVKNFVKSISVNNLADDIHAIPYITFVDNYRYIISKYIAELQTILLNAPKLSQPVYVYKSTNGIYPNLPADINCRDENLKCRPIPVLQYPFNSSSIDPEFNFKHFYDKKTSCCYYIIYIPKGNSILHISSLIHEFPHEDEVLLPFGATFNLIHKELTNRKIKTKKRDEIIPIETYIGIYSKPENISCVNMKLGTINCQHMDQINSDTFIYNHEDKSYVTGGNDIIITNPDNKSLYLNDTNNLVIWDSKEIPKKNIEGLYVLVHSKYEKDLNKTKNKYLNLNFYPIIIGTIVKIEDTYYKVDMSDVIKYIQRKYINNRKPFKIFLVTDN